MLLPALLLSLAPGGAPQDVEPLEERVNRAIDRGVAYLLREQSFDGSFGGHRPMWPRGTTGLASFTLSKSGLDREHPALHRARLYLAANPSERTYSLATELLFLGSMGSEEDEEQMERAVESLLDSQRRDGWAYPGSYRDERWQSDDTAPDFSNLHFGVFGLRAAEKAGIELPRGTWSDLAETILLYLGEPEEFMDSSHAVRLRAGYSYRVPDPKTKASLVAAGAAMLEACRSAESAKLSKSILKEIEAAHELNHAWLDSRIEIGNNADSGLFTYYWLGALERAQSLLGWTELGGLPVYEAGATWIVDQQKEDGSWRDGRTGGDLGATTSDTCFALLFLLRATGPLSSEAAARVRGVFESAVEDPVRIRVRVREDVEAYLLGVSGEEATPSRVRWLFDGEEIAVSDEKVSGRFVARWPVPHQGVHDLVAEVTCEGTDQVVRSKRLILPCYEVLEPWMEDAATAVTRNLLREVECSASVSSARDGSRAEFALDAQSSTRWMAEAADESPWFELELERPVRADTLVLGGPAVTGHQAGEFDRPTRLAVYLDGQRKPLEVELGELPFGPSGIAPLAIEFDKPRKVRRVRVEILGRQPGTVASAGFGFSEIGLELR